MNAPSVFLGFTCDVYRSAAPFPSTTRRFVFPASRAVSMVTLSARQNRKITARPLSGHLLSASRPRCSQRSARRFSRSGNVAFVPLSLPHRGNAASMLDGRATTPARLFLKSSGFDVRHGEDAGRRGYIPVINVCCLENTNKIKINEVTSTSSPNEAVSD